MSNPLRKQKSSQESTNQRISHLKHFSMIHKESILIPLILTSRGYLDQPIRADKIDIEKSNRKSQLMWVMGFSATTVLIRLY